MRRSLEENLQLGIIILGYFTGPSPFCKDLSSSCAKAVAMNKMSPGFFLDITENTGDTFSYVILPGSSFDDIPTKGRIYPIVQNIVRKRDIENNDASIV